MWGYVCFPPPPPPKRLQLAAFSHYCKIVWKERGINHFTGLEFCYQNPLVFSFFAKREREQRAERDGKRKILVENVMGGMGGSGHSFSSLSRIVCLQTFEGIFDHLLLHHEVFVCCPLCLLPCRKVMKVLHSVILSRLLDGLALTPELQPVSSWRSIFSQGWDVL